MRLGADDGAGTTPVRGSGVSLVGTGRRAGRSTAPARRGIPTEAAGAGTLPRCVRLGEDRGRPALLVDGVVQSVAPTAAAGGYWEAMLPAHRPRRALLLGLGGGTLAHLLVARFGSLPMVGVDDDPAVLAAARTAFGPLPGELDIVLADARIFIHGYAARFDYVAVDLFHGGEVPRGVFGQPFLRAVRAALMPGGTAAFNLFHDARSDRRLERLRRVLRVERTVQVRDNVLAHCRA